MKNFFKILQRFVYFLFKSKKKKMFIKLIKNLVSKNNYFFGSFVIIFFLDFLLSGHKIKIPPEIRIEALNINKDPRFFFFFQSTFINFNSLKRYYLSLN